MLWVEGEQLPLFADQPHVVATDGEKAERVWKGLEKRLSAAGLRMIAISWLSEERALNQPLFNFICKVFRQPAGVPSIENNASDADVLAVRNTCRRVLHEQLRMKQFIRLQKAMDGTYPHPTLLVAEHRDGTIVADAPRVIVIVEECLELITVVAVQSVVGSNPDASILILTKGVD